MRAVLVGVVVAALATTAAAGDADTLRDALEAERFHDAYAAIGAAIDEAPMDPEVRHLAARASVATWRLDEAEARLAEGLSQKADHAAMLGLYAWTRFLRGDDDTATDFAAKALELDPANPDALAVMARLDVMARARARAGGADPGLPAGSAAAFVDDALATDRLLGGAITSNGWVVDPDEQRDGDRVVVTVRLPSDRPIGNAVATSDAAYVALVAAAPEDARAALVERIAAARDPDLETFRVTVERRRRDRFVIVDVREDGRTVVVAGAPLPRPAERGDAPDNALVIGATIVGTIVLGALFATAVVAAQRRRRTARRNRLPSSRSIE